MDEIISFYTSLIDYAILVPKQSFRVSRMVVLSCLERGIWKIAERSKDKMLELKLT